MLFSIIIPNYNSAKWIRKGLDSIKEQTFTDYEIVIVDDISQDNSVEIIKEYGIKPYINKVKRFNGGTRNVAVEKAKGDYIVFMDCDDWFDDKYCLEEIARLIKEYNYPDCIRLPYRFIKGDFNNIIPLGDSTPQELVWSIFVAPWTKCIKRSLFKPFPENTMLEDVVQHIDQCDNIETIAVCERPIIVWNRNNEDAISQPGNAQRLFKKRISSVYRNIADLMDLDLKHDYCIEQRDWRVGNYKEIVRNGEEENM